MADSDWNRVFCSGCTALGCFGNCRLDGLLGWDVRVVSGGWHRRSGVLSRVSRWREPRDWSDNDGVSHRIWVRVTELEFEGGEKVEVCSGEDYELFSGRYAAAIVA